MRIAIFGDSHAGRMKLTLDRALRNSGNWSISWFINRSMGTHPLNLQVSGGDLSTVTVENFFLIEEKTFRADDFDAILCIGMGADIRKAMVLANQFSHPKIGETSKRHMTSEMWESALRDIFSNTQGLTLIKSLRICAPQIPLVYLPPARPMTWINFRPGHLKNWSKNIYENSNPEILSKIYVDNLRIQCLNYGAILVDQPESSIDAWCWTLPEYGHGKFDDESNESWVKGDFFHTNDAFASIYMESLRSVSYLSELPEI